MDPLLGDDDRIGPCLLCQGLGIPLALLLASMQRGDAIDRFTVLGHLGEGGMGVVVSAYDPALDRKVAIKVLRPDRLPMAPEEGRMRLLREAQAMARLSHPNVITVYEVGTVDDQVYVAMEVVVGETLGAWLAHERPWREVVKVFLEAGRGLAAAHRAGLVHRDFKPDNVLVGVDGSARVTDFGLAGVSGGSPTTADAGALAVPITRTGTIFGTPAYMAPEQHRGQEADARADQFSFCVALYEGLHRVRPFAGKTAADIEGAILAWRIAPSTAEVPRWLRAAVLRGMSPQPADRWPNMDALLHALARDPAGRDPSLARAAPDSVTVVHPWSTRVRRCRGQVRDIARRSAGHVVCTTVPPWKHSTASSNARATSPMAW